MNTKKINEMYCWKNQAELIQLQQNLTDCCSFRGNMVNSQSISSAQSNTRFLSNGQTSTLNVCPRLCNRQYNAHKFNSCTDPNI